MPKETVVKKSIKHVGYWNFKDFYNFCFDYLKDDLGYSLSEKNYEEKDAGGKEIKLKWEANKKYTDYYKGTIEVSWQILGMKDAEVERGGKVEKTNKGEVKLDIKGVLTRDYESKWEDTPFWKYMRGTYDKYIAKSLSDEYEDDLTDDVNDLIKQIKAFLQLQAA
jgi:hypothetical protein